MPHYIIDRVVDTLCSDAHNAAQNAVKKFPQPNYVLLKVAEESGEVIKAAVHFAEGRDTATHVREEIVQAMAMLMRLYLEGDGVNGVPPIHAAYQKESNHDHS